MKFNLFMTPTIPGTDREREDLRPIGRNNDRYQAMIEEIREISTLAEDVGFDAVSFSEHHFHSEGFEASVAPLKLLTDIAARTKTIKLGTLGLVLPTWDPIRLAEETAVLDHLSQGRLCVGLARGYQNRWANVLGQKYHVAAASMDGSEIDKKNRALFEEFFQIVKAAWTQDTLRIKTDNYEVPFPYEGIEGWPPQEFTRQFGAGELDEDGRVRSVCVIPRPYQDPHPPLWQPFSVSERTVRWCAEEAIVPWILIAWPETFRMLCEAYAQTAGAAGHGFAVGENVGVFRAVTLGDTMQEAEALGAGAGAHFVNFFGAFGFCEAFRMPEDEERFAGQPLPPSEWTYDRLRRNGYAIAGTPDDVKRQIEALVENVPVEWFGWYFDQGLLTLDEAKRQLELFGEHVIPAFADAGVSAPDQPAAAPAG